MDAPGLVRPDPTGGERTLVTQHLDRQRTILLRKVHGIERVQAATSVAATSLTLAGLLNHAAMVEDWWFCVIFLDAQPDEPWRDIDWQADPDAEFTEALDVALPDLVARYVRAVERARRITAAATSLDQLARRPRHDGSVVSLRWILLHMLEGTARHNGHADLLREAVDGTTGD